MEKMNLENDINVFFVTAESFPQGIKKAMDKLESLYPKVPFRRLFGISRPENGGGIVYKAAAEELEHGEGKKYGCDTMVIKKGEYVVVNIENFRENEMLIKKAFDDLLKVPYLDSEGYCVEWYNNDKDAVKCMIRLDK